MADSRSKILQGWADNVVKRILAEMVSQQISPHNPKYKGDGVLQRSIDYKIYNASGGDKEKIVFLYEYIALFVEYGVGNGQEYDAEKMKNPFRSGKKYYKSRHGEREPKPFLSPIIKQRAFSLNLLAAHTLGEEIATRVVNDFSVFSDDKKDSRIRQSKTSWWIQYKKAKMR